MSTVSQHTEWLSLIDVSGPFLAIPVLERAFPQGLDVVETPQRQRLRQAYDEWRDSVDAGDPELMAIHEVWLRLVLEELLEFDAEVMKPAIELPESLVYVAPEHGLTLKPDLAILSPDGDATKARLLITTYPPETGLEAVLPGDGWPASPAERMTLLCRATGVRLGLVTNGERWMLVDAPVGATAGYASWYARLWSQEPVTLRAFQSLLGVRRFFGPQDETLEALLESSLEHQEEVTDKLGEQVRRAVEVLVQALDRADIDRNRELLHDVTPSELYEAGLTIMMRLVFLLCAEERGLLLLGDSGYDQNYAISPLRAQLREEADRVGLEVLERRQDAWSRLLAVFRAVYGGIEHESLRMPALGGSLFDPDRFPFLEGRSKGTGWRETSAIPLPIDNHTVLMLLEALQVLEQRGGAQLLSYRALDVEQIGYVYEGLLEHTVVRVPRTTLGLVGSSKVKNPNVELAELESASLEGEDTLIETLVDRTGRSKIALGKALRKPLEEDDYGRLLLACAGDRELADRIRPFAHLLRADNWGQPLVYKASSFAVTFGADRRETGTHYTPKSLTEAIVAETLQPVAYVGPAEGEAREKWRLKPSDELLDLKICDPAMGSGAFLVQACRWLSERLLEAWQDEEQSGKCIRIDGKALDSLEGGEPLPRDAEERLLVARRLIAERCLYGVDINPMAVELAKLSIWLVTLAKGRPFGFLDHNLRSGDSLLGIHDLDQLRCLDMDPNRTGSGRKLFAQAIDRAVDEAVELRKRLRQRVILDIHDVEIMTDLNEEARRKLELPELIGDVLVGEVLVAGGKDVDTAALAIEVGQAIEGNADAINDLRRKARTGLSTDLPSGKPPRHPMHWPLEFPEVFERESGGFDAIVGNPPWGAELSEHELLFYKSHYTNSSYKLINSFKFFIERMSSVTANGYGVYSFLVPTSLLEHVGCKDTRAFLLQQKPYIFIDCGDGIFANVTQSCCYGVIGKDKASEAHFVFLSDVIECEASRTHSIFDRKYTKFKVSIPDIIGRPNSILSSKYTQIQFGPGWCVLKDVADVYDSGIDYSRKELGSDVFYKSHDPEDENDHKVLRGRNIDKFRLSFDGIWLRSNWREIQDEHRSRDRKSRLKVNEVVYKVTPKILVRQTGDAIICTLDLDAFFHQKSLLSVVPKGPVSASLICAYLNHPETTDIYRRMTMQTGKVFSQVKKNYLEQLPIPAIKDNERESQIESLVARLIQEVPDDQLRDSLVEQLNMVVSEIFIAAREAAAPDPELLQKITVVNEVRKKAATRKKRKPAKVYEIPSYSERDIPKATEPPSPQMDIFSNQLDSQSSQKKGNQWGSESIDQILAWLEAHPGWHSKQVILSGSQADQDGWGSAIKELLDDGFIEVQGSDGSMKYRASS